MRLASTHVLRLSQGSLAHRRELSGAVAPPERNGHPVPGEFSAGWQGWYYERVNKKHILWAILLIATLLRIVNLASGDITGSDEVFYAFRAVGPLDFDNAPNQTTPLEWQDPNVQWWTKLSMHDHPLLVFWVQHISMGIFGENNFGFRFPSAVLGIASVYLVYLIARKLISENAGLFSAALTAVTINHVYISRLGLQESFVIFFLLLCTYLFLKALDNPRFFIWTGVALGFAFLTKYTTFVAVPIFLSYLILFRRDAFRAKQFWLAVAATCLVASPILVYNLQLYRLAGHFDFQFSFIFGQDPEVWQSAPGKEEVGSLADRARDFIPNLLNSNSWLFLALVATAVGYFVIRAVQKKDRELLRQKALIDISLAWLILLLLFIGPTFRFLTLLTPFLAIKAGVFLSEIYSRDRLKKIMTVACGAILIWEMFYTTNSVVTNYPAGPQFWLWSKIRYDNYNWGANELENYLAAELSGKYPLLTFDAKYKFLEDLKRSNVESAKAGGAQPYAAMIIYSPVQKAAQLWSLDRRQIYYGWPVLTDEAFSAALGKFGPDYFVKSGIRAYYYITEQETQIEKQLSTGGFEPISLKNKRGEDVFRVYKFAL